MRLRLFILGFTIVLLASVALLILVWIERDPSQFAAGGDQPASVDSAELVILATPAPTDTPEPPAVTHRVAAGETLSQISLFYDVSMDDILAANDLDDPDLLQEGQELKIPGVSSPDSESVSPGESVTEPLPKPPGVVVNGLPESSFVILSPEAKQHAQEIFARGRALGRNPRAFSKVGDSTTEDPFFLGRFDGEPYNLGDFRYLQSVLDQYSGSYGRDSAAVRVGLHAWTLFDPAVADKSLCAAGEHVLACELRLHNPSLMIIRLGSNDVGAPSLFEDNMRQAVQYAIDNGVVPIIGTKADRSEGSNQNNDILRAIAVEYQLPLWEYDLVAGTVPGRGLESDGVHMTTFYAHDYTLPEAFQRGHALHNLTALMMLDTIWKEVILSADG